ncbi:MAG: Parvulin-like peptidyl-prolyl isomerase [Acidobacteria bacterium]|nr:Parvulin-like peptidyl-prolyl isomerase [Acidobacteriota bacterium]
MLKQLSRLKHTRNILILGFVFFMAISLVIFYRPGSSGTLVEPNKNTAVVAKVSGEEITVADIAQLKENYMQMLGGQISLAQLGGNKRFLDGLIRDRVVSQEAARLNLSASKAELKDRLVKQFTDPTGKFVFTDASSGKVDLKKYEDAVNNRYGGVERFERSVRDAIAQEKLRAFITASVTISPEEVQEEYKKKNTSFDLSYVIVSADKLAEKIQPTDQDLRAFYEQHKTDYRILEPQKKIRYLFIDQEKAGLKLQISDKELHDEYDRLTPENKQAGVKVQQILLKVARKDLDTQVEEKAKELIKKARGATGQATEEAYAQLARGNSEDPATAKNGGFLSRLIKKNPNKPDALYERAVDMQPGDVSDVPIKYAGNYYILRRGDAVPKTFEEAKPELLVSLRNRRGYTAAAGIAQKARESLKKSHDAQKVAQELAAEANMNPADMVRETPYIKQGDDVPGIGSNQQFEAAIAPLNNPNDVGEPAGVKGGFAVPMFVDKKEPRIPEFDEVKDKVAKAFKLQKAKELLDQKAREIATSVNSAADLKAAAEKGGLEVATEEAFKTGKGLGKLSPSSALDEAVYSLKQGEVSKSPIKVGDSWVIVGATVRKEADLAEFAKQREQLTETALRSRQDQVYEDYVASAIARMKSEGKVKVYKDVLDSIEEDEPQVAPVPQRRSFPVPTR